MSDDLRIRGELVLASRGWRFMKRERDVATFLRIEGSTAETTWVTTDELVRLGSHTMKRAGRGEG